MTTYVDICTHETKLDDIILTDFISKYGATIKTSQNGSIVNATIEFKGIKYPLFMKWFEKVDLNKLTLDDCFNYVVDITQTRGGWYSRHINKETLYKLEKSL